LRQVGRKKYTLKQFAMNTLTPFCGIEVTSPIFPGSRRYATFPSFGNPRPRSEARFSSQPSLTPVLLHFSRPRPAVPLGLPLTLPGFYRPGFFTRVLFFFFLCFLCPFVLSLFLGQGLLVGETKRSFKKSPVPFLRTCVPGLGPAFFFFGSLVFLGVSLGS